MVQGIFGVGGERTGVIRVAVAGPTDVLDAAQVQADDKGKILVGGAGMTFEAIKRASEVGAAGIVAGGVKDSDLTKFLGYDIGVAITGQESINLTLIVTEGFGYLQMAQRTFELLKTLEGKTASINGATQIRAGVIRPEVIVPVADKDAKAQSDEAFELKPGTPIRVIREPYFGKLGTVTELPAQLQVVDSGTEVRVLIERDGESAPLEFVLVREEIQLKNVTYADLLDGGIGYIRLERFSNNTGDEVATAIGAMKAKGEVRAMILDLRGNPGGLLTMAVSVVEKFVPKGSLVVTMRGRKPETEKKFFAEEDPVLPDVPLVVLIDRSSASASEIVAGAIQDLDRGVILGTRSFGKGLVQTITPLVYNTQIKITTAKYYTPSGRCIQEIDYAKRAVDSALGIMPDSLRRQFRTAKGRVEYERGGIQPDSVVDAPAPTRLESELLRKAMFYRFALWYAKQGAVRAAGDDKLFHEFTLYLEREKFTWQEESEVKLEEFAKSVARTAPSAGVAKEIDDLRTALRQDKGGALAREKRRLLAEVKVQLASRLAGEKGRIEASLSDDPQLAAAKGLLTGGDAYARRLSAGASKE